MNNFCKYLTPEEAREQDQAWAGGRKEPLEYYQALAADDSMCEVCEVEHAWKLAGTGLCFSCTTGEADASDDYELI